jgi:hypothetical protein
MRTAIHPFFGSVRVKGRAALILLPVAAVAFSAGFPAVARAATSGRHAASSRSAALPSRTSGAQGGSALLPGVRLVAVPGSKDGAISGEVLSVAGQGLPGACVQATAAGAKVPARTVSRAQGAYLLSGLVPGTYRVAVTRCPSGAALASGEVRLTPGHVAIMADIQIRLSGGPQAAEFALGLAAPKASSSPFGSVTTTGSISGTVTNSTGTALSGICAQASGPAGTFSAATASNGGYTISGLATGYYYLSFSPGCGNSTDYALQYYPDSAFLSGATVFSVSAVQPLTGYNAVLQLGGSVSGTVVDSAGAGISGICVTDVETGAEVNTGSSGSYTLSDLPVGGAFISFGILDGAPGSCGPNLSYAGFVGPGAVQVAAGGTTANVDATLTPGGALSGTVTDEAGTGLPGMCVIVSATAGGGNGGYDSAITGAGGAYTISDLASGSYAVIASPGCGGSLAYAQAIYEQGASVAVTAGQATTGIDIALQAGGSIGGTVTTGAGPVAGICVNVSTEGGGVDGGFTATSGSGAYLIPGLSAGLYSVTYQPGCRGSASVIGQTLNDVAVTDGQSTSGVNITLSAAGSISGTVTASGGTGAEGVCVDAAGNGVSTSSVSEVAITGSTGTYTVLGLTAGTYTVEFYSGCGGSTDYAAQYYNDQPTFATAASVTVTGTSDTPGINATMQLAGAISGTVLTASGLGLPGLCVQAFTTTSLAGQATTGADGAYTITDLAAGTYTVQFIAQGCGQFGGYPTQWYDNQLLVGGTPANVTVTSGITTGSINDTVLSLSGSISGQVTDSGGTGLGGICVVAIGSGSFSGDGNTATSQPNGDYTITGLAADTYNVEYYPGEFCGNNGNYQQQFYDNQPLGSSTPPTTVVLSTPSGMAATGINDALAAGGTISGTVTDATTSASLAGVCVSASGGSTGDFATGQTGANGSYTLVGLATDSYTVAFATSTGCGNNGPYAAQFYDNVASIGSATPVSVTAPQAVTGIDDALQYAYPVGSISGTVTSGSSGVGGICVALVSQSGPVVATGVTSGTGSYQIALQATGTYSVVFFSGCGNLGNYDTEFYGNGLTFPGNSVTINSGANTPNVNANLGTPSTPQPSAPGTPTGVAEPSAVSLSWTAPSSQGSSTISGYLVTPYIGSAAQAALQTNSTALSYTVTGLTDGTAYTFTVAAENASGIGAASANSAAITPVAPNPATYNPLTPYRICDTRSGNPSGLSGLDLTQCEGKTLTAGDTLTIQVAGTNPSGQTTGGVPSSATSVILNVTVTNTTVPSYLTVYPTGGARPLSSSVNWNGGQTVPNLVTVVLGTGGQVSLYNANGSTDVVVDVEGWMDSTGTSGGPYVPLTPYRICDTRPPIFTPTNQCTGHTLQAGTTLTIQVAGTNPLGTSSGGVPASGVLAVDLTVTATDPTVPSYLTVWPAGATRPVASNLNFVGGETVANNVVVAVPQSGPNAGQVSIYNANGSTDVVVDVSGYYATTLVTGAAKFTPMVPYRICDTRPTAISGLTDSCTGHTLVASGTAGAVLVLQVAGVGGIPAGATSVVLNVTVTDTTAADYLTIYPDGATRPNSSSLNWPAGETVASGVTATLGSDGALDFYIPQGSADLVVDVVGWEQ